MALLLLVVVVAWLVAALPGVIIALLLWLIIEHALATRPR